MVGMRTLETLCVQAVTLEALVLLLQCEYHPAEVLPTAALCVLPHAVLQIAMEFGTTSRLAQGTAAAVQFGVDPQDALDKISKLQERLSTLEQVGLQLTASARCSHSCQHSTHNALCAFSAIAVSACNCPTTFVTEGSRAW